MIHGLLLTLVIGATSNEQVLDAFEYRDGTTAAKQWVLAESKRPVRVERDGNRSVTVLPLPFASLPEISRAAIDRDVRLDLTEPGRFVLEVACDTPTATTGVNLYFRSGNGWYSAATHLTKKGWQKLYFPRNMFRTEGKPAGWDKIDRIRIAAWRGASVDSEIKIRRLATVWHDTVVVVPASLSKKKKENDPEHRGMVATAESMIHILTDLNIGCDALTVDAISEKSLKGRSVVILPHTPDLPDDAIRELEAYVRMGGKIFACYSLPPRLAKTLGFGQLTYVRQKAPGQFAEIHFDVDALPGLPPKALQNSWNITTAVPAGRNARVIARWFTADGKSSGSPAMLMSDSGVFFSHILLPEDRAAKKQAVAALLGALHPAIWERMVQGEMESCQRIGHLEGLGAVAKFVKQSKQAAALEPLETALKLLTVAETKQNARDFPGAVERARLARELLAEAYLRAMPGREKEGRAFWEHAGTGAYPGDWERTAKELSAAGFNMIIPNMLWGGSAHYASDILPRSEAFRRHGDQIAQCVEACKKHGIEVHVWKVNFNLSNAPAEFVKKLQDEKRTQVSSTDEVEKWLCPSHPDNVKLEVDSMLEVVRKYDVAGIHFDYIRYPDGDHCFCDGCRQRFEKESGKPVARWPEDCHRGDRRAEYTAWRCDQITRVVRTVSTEAKKVRPDIKISAAVFSAYPGCRMSVAQDWPAWVRAGYLDFLCPMDYTESDSGFVGLVTNQMDLVGRRIPLYPGIGATATNIALTADRVAGQAFLARETGADGFTIFNLTRGTIQQIVPPIGWGVGSQKAVPPHRKTKS